MDLIGISFSTEKSRLFRNLFFLLVFFIPIFTDSDVLKANKFTLTFAFGEVLSFAKFREVVNLAKQLTETKYTEIQNTNTNTNVKKGTSPFNVARALI